MYLDFLSSITVNEVCSVSTMYTPKNKKMQRTNRPRWAMVYKHSGQTVYSSCEKNFISDENHAIFLPKGCNYDWKCTKEGHFSIIEFESSLNCQEPFSVPVKSKESILKAIKELEYKIGIPRLNSHIEGLRDFYSLLLLLIKTDGSKYTPSSKKEKIIPAIEYISANYSKNITNDTLAELCGMSTVYFRKIFTEAMKTSPISYAKSVRLEKAKEMLKSDYTTLSDVAEAVGYTSIYNFSRDFKKHTGFSPSKIVEK